MGMYTECCLHFNLRADTPQSVIDVLNHMLNGDGKSQSPELPEHPLFKADGQRWWFMLRGGSSYFDGPTHSTLRRDEMTKEWEFGTRFNIKNYEGEIEHFIDWIAPYVATDGKLWGYTRYEEFDKPTLIYPPGFTPWEL